MKPFAMQAPIRLPRRSQNGFNHLSGAGRIPHLGLILLSFASFADLLEAAPPPRKIDGNRLTYLDELNPYYVSHDFPKLTTPQWLGEDGVDAVVVLAIDDMRDPPKYEAYLRPILQRLKQIDGRAPVSIMTCKVRPDDPQLQSWLAEGLSIEIHTVDHPCPLLKDGDFVKAKKTYDDCIDLMHQIPGNEPVAFRMPCCDSLNTVSPRAYAEIFNKTTPGKHFLQVDSSVFNVVTWKDPELPREIVFDEEGKERFRKYLPADRTFVNTIENYPYPYVVGGLCWEFPCVTPSDWSAQHRHKSNNPVTIRDWKAYLDACVIKQGTFNLVFHPHGWVSSEQVVEFIDYAQTKYGKRIKFLTFREAIERLNYYMLTGVPIRAEDGSDNGVRILDVNNDGYLDVVVANDKVTWSRIWSPDKHQWLDVRFPILNALENQKNRVLQRPTVADPRSILSEGKFAVIDPRGFPAFFWGDDSGLKVWCFDGKDWLEQPKLLNGMEINGNPVRVVSGGSELGIRFRDLNGDGICELISGFTSILWRHQLGILGFDVQNFAWHQLPFSLPSTLALVDAEGNPTGLRFFDIDEDGYDDLVYSTEFRYRALLFDSMEKGWSIPAISATRSEKNDVPAIVRNNANNGAWFHSRHLFVQNEDTAGMKDLVARVSFDKMLEGVEPRAKSPEQSRSLIETKPEFIVELMAAEPLVMDPVAFEWGADGKLWVAEMADYPLGLDNKGKPGGRVRYLEDTDGDGTYDKSTLFVDGLNFPNGVMPWRNGVLISAAPDILFAEDTDGDGKADRKEVLFHGFIEGNQQHRINGFTYGLDNWLYLANGDSDGDIVSAKTGKKTNIRGHDIRVRPDTGEIDLIAGKTQFGRNRDDWGNWFGSSNSDPMYQFVIAEEYLRRNPALAVSGNKRAVSVQPGPSPVFPISRSLPRFNDFDRLNRFTSACSAIVYRDELFGPEFAGNAFVSEPVHNLVHREVMSADGLTFTSHRPEDEEKSEFLTSRDNWFRPTMIKTGPDGALWIADMYRHLIEHPQYIPKEQWDKLPMRAGEDKGRLYRVYPKWSKPRAIARLHKLSTDQLAAALDSPSGWQRDTAQRLLVERHDDAAIAPLERLASESSRGLARLHALCTLDGLNALKPELVLALCDDKEPGVRRHAVRMAEQFVDKHPDIGPAIAKRIEDSDAQVRLQAALSLGAWHDPQADAALAKLLARETQDRYFVTGILSSLTNGNIVAVLKSFLENKEHSRQHPDLTGRLFAMAASTAAEDDAAIAQVLDLLFATEGDGEYQTWQLAALAEVFDARERQRRRFFQGDGGRTPNLSKERERTGRMIQAARKLARAEKTSHYDRLTAIRLLGRDEEQTDEDIAILAEFLTPRNERREQSAAIARLGAMHDPKAMQSLINGWSGYGPELRGEVIESFFSRRGGSEDLLDALEAGTISPAEISADRRERLLNAKFGGVRTRAEKLFAGAISADRQKVVDQYRAVLELKGDAARGEKLFAKTCSTCHKLGTVGHAVGPDLGAVKNRDSESLLVSMFDPNRAVESKFLGYVAVTVDGKTFTGVLANESGGSITLVAPDGKEQVLLRQDLEEMRGTGKSLMPEGLEKDLSPQDAADLILFVQQAEKKN